MTQPLLFVRQPGDQLASGEVTHIDRSPVDVVTARRQWDSYVDCFRSDGWEVVEVEASDEHPDAVFIEDALVLFDDLAVITRPGAPSRLGEIEAVPVALDGAGFALASIGDGGTLDGGDVLKVGRHVWVGLGGRTNASGIEQLQALLAPRGWTVAAVPMTKALHLKSAVTALPDGRIIGWEPVVDDPTQFEHFVSMPEEAGAHVVHLRDGSMLMAAGAPASRELIQGMGYPVTTVEIGEFEKLEGCVTCLSVRDRR